MFSTGYKYLFGALYSHMDQKSNQFLKKHFERLI
jgi:hypothetical protein